MNIKLPKYQRGFLSGKIFGGSSPINKLKRKIDPLGAKLGRYGKERRRQRDAAINNTFYGFDKDMQRASAQNERQRRFLTR